MKKANYILPFPKRLKVKRINKPKVKYKGKIYLSHKERTRNAVDFIIPEGTPILAARPGIVVRVKSDSKIGGPNPKFFGKGNFITIVHKDGTFADYLHLKYKGVKVKVGDHVKQGQVIGHSGNTGWSMAPHLHFIVWKFVGLDWKSIKINFKK
jgi:murein DD-endopeptidase MepM/ murein hydrolase activator NlpD